MLELLYKYIVTKGTGNRRYTIYGTYYIFKKLAVISGFCYFVVIHSLATLWLDMFLTLVRARPSPSAVLNGVKTSMLVINLYLCTRLHVSPVLSTGTVVNISIFSCKGKSLQTRLLFGVSITIAMKIRMVLHLKSGVWPSLSFYTTIQEQQASWTGNKRAYTMYTRVFEVITAYQYVYT